MASHSLIACVLRQFVDKADSCERKRDSTFKKTVRICFDSFFFSLFFFRKMLFVYTTKEDEHVYVFPLKPYGVLYAYAIKKNT